MRIPLWAFAAAAMLVGCATPTDTGEAEKPLPIDDPALDALASTRLETFRDDGEFRAYLKSAKAAAEARGSWWASRPIRLAQAEIPCEPGMPCEAEEIVVTGAKISAAPASITDTQKAGVDEGDIVKNFGRFLIVLQDGRLFSIDTGASSSALKLVDRENVYRDPESDAWYDEMVIHDNRIAVLGYSYDEEASEIAVFEIAPEGALSHQATYFISADDYYDGDNYATRLVGDKLIVYTPFYLQDVDPEKPLAWPLARRWIKEGDGGRVSPGVNLYGAEDIYKPIQRTVSPVVHAVSVCPLSVAAGAEFDCRTTAIVGPDDRQFYVSDRDVYLWLSAASEDIVGDDYPPDCAPGFAPGFGDSAPAALFRLPLDGGAPKAIRTKGYPQDQFALDSNATHFRALLSWAPHQCDNAKNEASFKLLTLPLSAFGATPRTAPERRYAPLPPLKDGFYENRFTDDYVVYGSRKDWGTSAPDDEEGDLVARIVAAPIDRPAGAVIMSAPHNVIRAERVGDDIVVTGYKNAAGLSVSAIKLGGLPRLADTEILEGRYESEGRSHAFNSLVDGEGAGLMGLPTVAVEKESTRWVYRSDASDVSFLSVDAEGRLLSAGELMGSDESEHEDYECEVSCVDWYGNTRPIFLGGRIFGLSGAELIEGRRVDGRIVEIGRLNITAPKPQ
ncbi:MAG: beta-propeller domain-containing protein [Parvularculaceae bacterium]